MRVLKKSPTMRERAYTYVRYLWFTLHTNDLVESLRREIIKTHNGEDNSGEKESEGKEHHFDTGITFTYYTLIVGDTIADGILVFTLTYYHYQQIKIKLSHICHYLLCPSVAINNALYGALYLGIKRYFVKCVWALGYLPTKLGFDLRLFRVMEGLWSAVDVIIRL